MRKLKRLLAAVLTAAMLATFLPAGVLAAEQDGSTNPPSETIMSGAQSQNQDEQDLQDQQDQQNQQDQLDQQGQQNQQDQGVDEDSDEGPEGGPDKPEETSPISLEGLNLYAVVNGEKVYLEPSAATFSLIPLEYHSYDLNLSNYFPMELKSFSISDMVRVLTKSYSDSYNLQAGDVKAFAKWGFYDEDGNYVSSNHDDDYTAVGADATIDLSYGVQQGGGTYQLELIVGTADPLNPSNVRCRIDVQVGYHYDLLETEAYTVDNPRQEITVYDDDVSLSSYDNRNILYIPVDPDTWREGQEANLGLKLDRNYSGFTVKVYEGRYETEEAITNAGATEITSQIMDQTSLATTGGYRADYSWKNDYTGMPEVTLVLTRSSTNETACVMPVILYMYPDELYVGISNLYTNSSGNNSAGFYRRIEKTGFEEYRIYTLYSGNKANGTYYVNLHANDPETNKNGADAVKGAYEGNYASADAATAAGKSDIKSQLFNYSSRYPVNFSQYPNGVQFTVIDNNDRVWHFGIEVEERPEGTSLPPAPTPLSEDTYFRVRGALTEKDGTNYNSYFMKYSDDSYYYRGYQTVFLLNSDGSPVSAGQITPSFETGNKVEIYAGHDVDGTMVAAVKQTSGETPVSFTSGNPIQYSAAAENGSHLKNYFVTFLTQQDSPTLFVNGANDETNYQEDPQDATKKIPARVVNLTRDYNYHHDIFFANLGKDALTGLSVKLTGLDGTGEAENVTLDDYWTVKDTKTLAGFTSASKQSVNGTSDPYGELPNVSKIRLVPQLDDQGNMKAGQINGLLSISADGIDPVKILLTGSAGSFQINTNKLLDGVKFVSYSCLIQTNYVSDGYSDTDAVTFSATGLPSGINIRPNGELYGIPTTPGTYNNVTITATATIDGERKSDTKTYTIIIEDNTDMNVWRYDSMIWSNLDYTPQIAIPNENDDTNIGTNASTGDNSWDKPTQILETWPAGDYACFIDRVFIDGVQLTPGVDYTSAPGSIKLTIQTQTLRSFGNGTHTISAESRIGGANSTNLRRTAQNYTLTTLGTSRPSNGGSSSSGSSNDNSSSSSSSYAINMADVPNGRGSASATSAKPGTKVTVIITPDGGYAPAGLTVTRTSGRSVSTVKVSDTEYTFIMPSGAVTITPSFRPVKIPVTPVVGSFTDVLEGDWFCEAVRYVFDRGLMVGISDDSFDPNGTVSRSMLVTVLYSIEGRPMISDTSPFSDVQPGQWFAAPVIWAAKNNLVAGFGDGTFGVNSPLTREQAAVILYGYARMKGYEVTPSSDLSQFADRDSISAFALTALQWANGTGLISGYNQDTLAPGGTTTRAQLAVIFKNFCENILK